MTKFIQPLLVLVFLLILSSCKDNIDKKVLTPDSHEIFHEINSYLYKDSAEFKENYRLLLLLSEREDGKGYLTNTYLKQITDITFKDLLIESNALQEYNRKLKRSELKDEEIQNNIESYLLRIDTSKIELSKDLEKNSNELLDILKLALSEKYEINKSDFYKKIILSSEYKKDVYYDIKSLYKKQRNISEENFFNNFLFSKEILYNDILEHEKENFTLSPEEFYSKLNDIEYVKRTYPIIYKRVYNNEFFTYTEYLSLLDIKRPEFKLVTKTNES